jgi:hypothetical protein
MIRWNPKKARKTRGHVLYAKHKGQAYTEFVVVLPGVLLLLLLAWEFAYFWWGRMVVSTATFEAARQVAAGEPTATGYGVYAGIMETGMGRMVEDHEGDFWIQERPNFRSVSAQARVPYRWPTGLGALMGGRLELSLQSSAFFRLEEFYPGPPGETYWFLPGYVWE